MGDDIVLRDSDGNLIVLTRERLSHITEHPEISLIEDPVATTVLSPDAVVRSRTDETISLLYKFYENLTIGDKYCCVVIKYAEQRNFIVTAYMTDRIKEGNVLWKK